MLLPVTLCTAAAAGILTLWMMVRTGQVRAKAHIAHGDGDNPHLIRRMRAQLNFVESAPFILLLIAGIELSGKGGQWLGYIAAFYILGRIAHTVGMDNEEVGKPRMIGVAITMLTLIGLSVVAVLIAAGVM